MIIKSAAQGDGHFGRNLDAAYGRYRLGENARMKRGKDGGIAICIATQ